MAQRAGKTRRVKAIHAKIRNRRTDFLQKRSTELTNSHAAIFVGNVKPLPLAKTRMAKSVLNAGWSSFRTMLRYKCDRAGVLFEEVDESYSTQTCSCCGALPPERPKGIAGLGIRDWTCGECGASHDRDINAARNILAAGHRRLAVGIPVLWVREDVKAGGKRYSDAVMLLNLRDGFNRVMNIGPTNRLDTDYICEIHATLSAH